MNTAHEPDGMEFARKSLQGVPPLNQDRISEIVSRINEGYYFTPEVISEIADRIADEMTDHPKPPPV